MMWISARSSCSATCRLIPWKRPLLISAVRSSRGHWRVSIAAAANFRTKDGYLELHDWDSAVNYSTGGGTEFAGGRVDASTSPDVVADLILSACRASPQQRTTRSTPSGTPG
jgi:ligand-binding sensor domain-containing protein